MSVENTAASLKTPCSICESYPVTFDRCYKKLKQKKLKVHKHCYKITNRHQFKAHLYLDKRVSFGLSHKFFNVYVTVPKGHYQGWEHPNVKVKTYAKLSLSTPWWHVQGAEIHLLWFVNSGTRWRWVVSLAPWPLYPQRKTPQYPLNRRLAGHLSQSAHFGDNKSVFAQAGIELPTAHPTSPSLPQP
jgi:hypothetical protein